MKRICVSAGLAALGAVAAQAQYAPGLGTMETTKPWALSATIRGFYDDNYLTLPKTIPGPNGTSTQGARGSYGTEASPSASYNHSTSDTLLAATYTYDMHWYEDGSGTVDQSHQFNARLDHEFSERYKLQMNESFVIAQDPAVIDPAVITAPLRIPGNNIHNTASLDFGAQLSKLFDLHVGYVNNLYAYQENQGDEYVPAGQAAQPSYSGLLDRIDQTAAVDLRWKARPETTGVLGYQYEHLVYTSPELIIDPATNFITGVPIPGFRANVRNNNSHYVYVGADQSFSPKLNASIRLGAQDSIYYNYGSTTLSPYANASISYTYMVDSSAQLGVTTSHNSTDVAGLAGVATSPVLDEETTTAYLSVTHHVSARLTAAMLGQAQFSKFNGGGAGYNGLEEDLYVVTLSLSYHFTPWLSGESGYTYTALESSLSDRSYTRNLMYLGLRATY